MKKNFLALSFLLLGCRAANAQTKNFIDQPYIEVQGEADTLVVPDCIFIKIVLSEKDSKGKISVEEQEKKMIDGLKAIGIAIDKDLSLSDASSNYKFYILKTTDIFKTKQYQLLVHDAPTASKVFVQLESLGISNTSIDRVEYSALKSVQNLMLGKAIENAKMKAVAASKPLGQIVGQAILISTIPNSDFENGLSGRLAGVSVRSYYSSTNISYSPPLIEFEKIKVASKANVTFILK